MSFSDVYYIIFHFLLSPLFEGTLHIKYKILFSSINRSYPSNPIPQRHFQKSSLYISCWSYYLCSLNPHSFRFPLAYRVHSNLPLSPQQSLIDCCYTCILLGEEQSTKRTQEVLLGCFHQYRFVRELEVSLISRQTRGAGQQEDRVYQPEFAQLFHVFSSCSPVRPSVKAPKWTALQ